MSVTSSASQLILSFLVFVSFALQWNELAYALPSVGYIDAPKGCRARNIRLVEILQFSDRKQSIVANECAQLISSRPMISPLTSSIYL